ncbi:NAD-dependent epimerase/dehydratase [Melioribacter roseus P3M-2]|uniref:dTDP-4-dehydrorhamnose reductase n=1 Tax=Melioribacter roseus (strain DSM 23840 / JCM 17771 / VKM B-2668 / P3M-2) TaxID=1191523 RepID=I6Z8D4_MELRP|nr:SDR family oxidoreductase [Melioribacter roseus]AFN75410.1 NAD-dependent epimerase/dehydratase [Melioribacter roseus P3M-2]
MKKISVIGASGMLGFAVSSYFVRKGYNVTEITRKEFDIATDSMNKLENLIEGSDTVINCAGVIKPTIAKNSVEAVLRINSMFPRNLAKLCNKKNIKCIHITTDCVYTGKKGKYTEEDYFDADDLYGLSKNAGETNDCMVLRTSIIGEEKDNSRSLLEWAKSQAGKEVNGFMNHLWNGVTTLYLAEVIEKILIDGLYKKGIYHIFSPDTVNKYDLLKIFNEVYHLNLKINPVNAESAVDRSLDSVYGLSGIVSVKPLRRQIEEMKEFFENEKAFELL